MAKTSLPKAGELDSGSFILSQVVQGVQQDVCWMFAIKNAGGDGSEHWWWKNGFTSPEQGAPVQWTLRKDQYTTGQWSMWQAVRRPMATVFRIHDVDIDDPNSPNP